MTNRALRLSAAMILAASGMAASAASLSDDFESYVPGNFPAAKWLDAAVPFPVAPPFVNLASPSAAVVATTDAFGVATQALQTAGSLGVSKGIYAAVPVSSSYSLVADIRTLRFANSDAGFVAPPSDWSMQLTFAQTGVANFSVAPQAGLYVSSLTHSWRFFLISANGGPLDDFDLGVAATLDTWYTVSLDVDASTGNFHSIIRDTSSGILLHDETHGYLGWKADYAAYDSIAFFGGETGAFDPPVPGSTTIASIAQVDNVNIQAVPVPEPTTWSPMGIGLVGLCAMRRRSCRTGGTANSDGGR